MCLGHVYIALEPVGSARLTFDDDLYYELCDLMTEYSSKSRMRSRTWRGVSKWSRGKDRYIGRLYSNIGKVPSDSGIFRSIGELREFTGRSNGPYWAIRERREGPQGVVAPSPWAGPNWTRRGAAPPSFLLSLPLFPSLLLLIGKGILLGLGSPSRTPYAWRTPLGPATSSLPPLYTGEGSTPKALKICLSRVRCPPPQLHTSVISS